ncbi:MAG: hypothetical protein RB191_19695, partial [Terriglobia bacterium]|nr:hypothetical protein [Terriglobia bacterium]
YFSNLHKLSFQFDRFSADGRCSAGSFRIFTVTAEPVDGSDCAHSLEGKGRDIEVGKQNSIRPLANEFPIMRRTYPAQANRPAQRG